MPLIHIKSKKFEFKFEITGKYTLLKGDSGIGKTTFYNLVSEMTKKNLGVQNLSKIDVVAVPQNFEDFKIERYSNAVLVIDENCSLFDRRDCSSLLKSSNNYFIIINRAVNYLPLHVDSVCTLKCSNHFYTFKHLYERFKVCNLNKVDCIVVEDSSSGFTFIKDVLSGFELPNNLNIVSSKGASSIISVLDENYNSGKRHFVIVYDAAAFGGYIGNLHLFISNHVDCTFFVLDWESFEHYILSTEYFNKQLSLSDTGCKYESLEQLATAELRKLCPLYNKSSLVSCFRRSKCRYCKRSGCKYRSYPYTSLICDKLLLLYKFCDITYVRKKVDFSYKKFVVENNKLKKSSYFSKVNTYRIISLSENIATIENLESKGIMNKSIIEIVQNVMLCNICLTNPSELKDWFGWSGILN